MKYQLTTDIAREIYGAGADFSESATSTAIDPAEAARTASAMATLRAAATA
jgi:phosphonate transport system ATP-binding protein